MKGIMKKSTAAKRKIAAIVLCALMLVNMFSAAVEDHSLDITLYYDGVCYTYSTHAHTVEELINLEGILIKPTDIMSHNMTDPIVEGMVITVDVAKYVTIHDDAESVGVITYVETVEQLLEESGRALAGRDTVYPSLEEKIYDGAKLLVSRCKDVTFTRNGSTLQYYTYDKTVAEFLEEAGVVLGDDEMVVPDLDAPITDDMTITVKKKVNAMSPLDFDVDLSNAKVLICEASAYTASADECWPYADGYTATGVKCEVGVVAVDPRVIPLKSKLYIETLDGSFVYGYCTAEDTGGAIKGNKIDLAMNTKAECFQFGRRQVRVYVLPA